MEYLVLKWAHIIGATIIFGTGLGTAFHFWITQRREDPRAIAAAARSTVLADWIFTLPAVILQPLTGLALALMAGYPLHSTWLVGALVLYGVAAACWIRVLFIQLEMRALAEAAVRDGTPLGADFRRLVRGWVLLGWPAFIAMIAIFWLMIARPA
jgi:uncharacterized membrane protein